MTCEHDYKFTGTITTPEYSATIEKCSKCKNIIETDKISSSELKLYGLRLRNQLLFKNLGLKPFGDMTKQ